MDTEAQLGSFMKFDNSWLPWIALRHFLPASAIRSLCVTMIHEMSGGRLSLEEIVDERLGGGNAFMETWLIRPKACSTPLAKHLQQYVQRIVWQNDDEIWPAEESIEKEAAISPAALRFAFNLGGCDLLHVTKSLPENGFVQAELKAVYEAISACALNLDVSSASNIDRLLNDIDGLLIGVSIQLRIVTLKHLGDLLCDRDRWEEAKQLYEHAKTELEKLVEPERSSDFALAMKSLISQSLAASATITDGAGAGQKILADLLNAPPGEQTIVLANAGLDEYVARVRSSEILFQNDTRSATLIAPLLADSHTNKHAFTSWQANEFPKAEAWFWSTLRRQTALGLITASKTTKGNFASCMIDYLTSSKSHDADSFKLAIGLLIESENPNRAKKVEWSEDFLDDCLDEALCRFVIEHTEAHVGAYKYRQTVAIVLFSEWARNIGAGRESLATLMLDYLIRIGSDSDANLRKDGADFTTCFEAILDICKRRPEFRLGIRDELADVLSRRIGNTGYWSGEQIALQLATECASAFTDEGLKKIVSAVVELLEITDPSDGNWVIVKPAIRLLSEECIGDLAESKDDLGGEIVRIILKFTDSDGDGTYAADIIFALNRYPAVLLHTQGVEDQYKPLVKQALTKASAINSSNAINNMMALLVAPRVVGQEAISSVLKILGKIIESGTTGESVLSFGSAYLPIRYLVAYGADICRESAMPVCDLNRALVELHDQLKSVWQQAITHPSIFAPLALLRKPSADRVLVHNWVITSLELADFVGQLDSMVETLKAAGCEEQLSDGISLGFATRHAGGAPGDADVAFMSTESRGAFYSALGRRLSALQGNADRNFTTGLFMNMLRHGPRQVDAAVFTSVLPKDVDNPTSLIQALEDYDARIGENRELSLTLKPLLERWKQGCELN